MLTLHIGGVVELYRSADARLEIHAQASGYTSHVIGTRNLDMALSGDFNGDGRPEVVLPTQSLDELAAIQHTPEGAQEMWRLPIGGLVSTNLSAIALPGGGMALGIGREDGVLRVWVSR